MLSLEERERRLKAVQSEMEKLDIDVLVVASNMDLIERGRVKYLTGWSTVLFESFVIVPKRGSMKYFGHYVLDANEIKNKYGIEEAYYPPFGENPGPHLAKVVKDLKPKKVGLCGTSGISAYIYLAFVNNLDGIPVVDATDIVDNLKMVKSSEELKYVEQSAALADYALEYFKQILKPGKIERDLVYEVDCELKKRGAEDSFYFIGSGKVPAPSYPVFACTRKIEQGDLVLFNCELLGIEGYGTQGVRLFSLGEPEKEVSEGYEVLKLAFEEGRKKLKTGNRACDVANAMLDVVKKEGYSMALHMGHGQGLALMERPFPMPDDTRELKTNMTITLHPQVVLPNGVMLFVATQYVVTEEGGRSLHKTPNEIIIV